jgi:hypothetical protein
VNRRTTGILKDVGLYILAQLVHYIYISFLAMTSNLITTIENARCDLNDCSFGVCVDILKSAMIAVLCSIVLTN